VVVVIEGSRENIKVTFGEDLARVDAIMGERGKR
jgi:2-C-methyl-D-erythritol 4-phosphate cytidylyltransferase